MASLVERLRGLHAKFEGQAGRSYTAALFLETADRITALEAMWETLVGYVDHAHGCGDGVSHGGGKYTCTCGLSEALTQYRAMKEKNDG